MNKQENIQVIQNLYTAFGQADLPALLNTLSPDVDWLFVGRPEDVPFAGQWRGHAQVTEFFGLIGQTLEVLKFEPREMMAFDDKVLVLGCSKARVKATGRIFEADWTHLYAVQNGKIIRLREFYDTATMAAAFREDRAESANANKAIARRFVNDGINTANLTVFDELLVPDVIDHYAPPGLPPGREGWKQTRRIFLIGFPDGHWVEEDLIAEGDTVVGRYTFRGTHQGEFFGIPATGKQVTVSNIHIMRLVAGKVVEHWGNGDDLGMLQQLGAVPEPAS